jgi:hypothetical protein
MGFVYKWIHLPTLNWYVGSHTGKNANASDGYICSSKIVKPMVRENPQDWFREIIAEGTDADMIALEAEILQTFDAKNDPRSFNLNNAMLHCGAWNKGINGAKHHRYGKKLSYKKPHTVSQKYKEQMQQQARERNSIQTECPHCNKTGQMVAMKRWHFDNCGLIRQGE